MIKNRKSRVCANSFTPYEQHNKRTLNYLKEYILLFELKILCFWLLRLSEKIIE